MRRIRRLGVRVQIGDDADERLGALFAPGIGVLKQHVVHFPKTSLQPGRFGGARRGHGVGVHRQRKLPKNEAHAAGIIVLDFQSVAARKPHGLHW